MGIKMKVGLVNAILIVALTASAFPANAETIYSYTGNPYSTIAVPSSGYTTADRITATLTFAKPLPPNQTLAWGAGGIGTATASDTLTGFFITDGVLTYAIFSDSSDSYNIFLATGNQGQIIGWFVGACKDKCTSHTNIDTVNGLGIGNNDLSSAYSFGPPLAYNINNPGVWSTVHNFRWDVVRVDTSTTPPTILAGGTNTSAAADGSTLSLTGSGIFVVGESDEVSGGGTWKTVASDGTPANGTYQVTGLVRFDLAPGTFPLLDGIGDATNARPGLAVLRIAYSDGTRGILVVSCSLAGTPKAVFEGTTVTKGFVHYLNKESGFTLFHVIPENED